MTRIKCSLQPNRFKNDSNTMNWEGERQKKTESDRERPLKDERRIVLSENQHPCERVTHSHSDEDPILGVVFEIQRS